jgi:hypothetical protein
MMWHIVGTILVIISTGSAGSFEPGSAPNAGLFASAILRALRDAKEEIKGPAVDKLAKAILERESQCLGTVGNVGGATGATQTVKTCGGTAQEAPCVFPFTYQGKEYKQCTSDDHDQPWCATQPGDYASHGKWGNCNCASEGSFQSKNYPSRGIALRSTAVHLEVGFWRLVSPGLSGVPESVSFQSVGDPNKYLRHQGYLLYEHKNDGSTLFKADASFFVRKNKFFSDFDAFESVNFPGHFIRHSGFRLRIQISDGSILFKNDASFKSVIAPHTCGGNSGDAACAFPFTYNGVVYSTCTTRDHNQPWCATQSVLAGARVI